MIGVECWWEVGCKGSLLRAAELEACVVGVGSPWGEGTPDAVEEETADGSEPGLVVVGGDCSVDGCSDVVGMETVVESRVRSRLPSELGRWRLVGLIGQVSLVVVVCHGERVDG